MGWVHRINDSVDYVSLSEKNIIERRVYLSDAFALTEERLVARRNYEEPLKNLSRRAKAAGCDPGMIDPEYQRYSNASFGKNVEPEAWPKRAERIRQRAQAGGHVGSTCSRV
jgi:hypothetical protein